MNVQLEFFATEEESELRTLKQLVDLNKKSLDSVRRGLFAKCSELGKMYMKQQEEIDQLKQIIKELKECQLTQQQYQSRKTTRILSMPEMTNKPMNLLRSYTSQGYSQIEPILIK